MLATRKLVTVFSILAAGMIVAPVYALRVTEPAAASHGYPGLCDMNGKKLADGEFRQWVENDRLHVVITYKFSACEVYEEHSQFRQEPELIQEKWSWKESKHGRSRREFAVDFLSGFPSAHVSQDHKDVSKRINIEPEETRNPRSQERNFSYFPVFLIKKFTDSALPALSSSRPGLSALSLPCKRRTFCIADFPTGDP